MARADFDKIFKQDVFSFEQTRRLGDRALLRKKREAERYGEIDGQPYQLVYKDDFRNQTIGYFGVGKDNIQGFVKDLEVSQDDIRVPIPELKTEIMISPFDPDKTEIRETMHNTSIRRGFKNATMRGFKGYSEPHKDQVMNAVTTLEQAVEEGTFQIDDRGYLVKRNNMGKPYFLYNEVGLKAKPKDGGGMVRGRVSIEPKDRDQIVRLFETRGLAELCDVQPGHKLAIKDSSKPNGIRFIEPDDGYIAFSESSDELRVEKGGNMVVISVSDKNIVFPELQQKPIKTGVPATNRMKHLRHKATLKLLGQDMDAM
ncbi:MAG: hypothetical protein CMP22_08205 [Rickettsiales bacterium]|nr:hypothetical protein [Rickettsiales bacterium]|tara:strand:- start:245 stop:1186 length:942 start_codon:yes stop_codon:yes gene_type:complete